MALERGASKTRTAIRSWQSQETCVSRSASKRVEGRIGTDRSAAELDPAPVDGHAGERTDAAGLHRCARARATTFKRSGRATSSRRMTRCTIGSLTRSSRRGSTPACAQSSRRANMRCLPSKPTHGGSTTRTPSKCPKIGKPAAVALRFPHNLRCRPARQARSLSPSAPFRAAQLAQQ